MTAWVPLRELLALGPRENDNTAALRVALGVALPTLALLAWGRPELTIYAVFGAFTGMYGRSETHQRRATQQSLAALMLIAGVAVGILLSEFNSSSWILVAVESGFAGAASIFADRSGLRPAGPFFALFALGACASVPLAVSPIVAIGTAIAAAGCSLAIGFAGWFWSRAWVREAQRQLIRGGVSDNALAYIAAVGTAGALSTAVGIGHPIWAMAAAAVPLGASSSGDRIIRGAHRILGTLAGILVAAAILLPFGSLTPALLALLVVVFQFPSEMFMTRNYGLALVFFTPLILIMTELAHPSDPIGLLSDRAVETVLGALVGMAIVFLPQRSVGGISRVRKRG